MKLTLLILMVSLCQIHAGSSYGQNAKVTLYVNNVSLESVLEQIELQTDYKFIYKDRDLDYNRKVSITVKKEALSGVLDRLFQGLPIDYEIFETQIILKPKPVQPETDRPVNEKQDGVAVSGKVSDESGVPLPGASIVEKGTETGTTTDFDGNFSLEVGSEDAVLVISYMGFATQEVPVKGQHNMMISLAENAAGLEEVVVIGYGSVKRANLGGAVSTIDAEAFESRSVLNAANSLQGVAPGLTVIRNGGAPGNNPTIRIRDISSINGGSPLVLIDGAEGDLNLLNPEDIENISVLKDGTAAIYGARAADGVILVTTKSGKKNQDLKIRLETSYAIKTPALLKRPANLYEHAAMGLEITDGSFPTEYTQEELDLIRQGSEEVITGSRWGRWSNYAKFYKNQDWNDHVIGNGNLQKYNVEFSGGGEKYSYMVSLGTVMEDGLPKFGVDRNKRYFARINSTIALRENLEYDINLSYQANDRNFSSVLGYGQNVWELIYKTRSWAPVYNPEGNFYVFEGFDNPAQVLEEGGNTEATTGNFTLNNQLSWKVTDELNLVGRAVIRKSDGDEYIVQKRIYEYNWENVQHRVARSPNSAERNYSKTLYKNFTAYADYKGQFGKHTIGAMAGTAHESSSYDRFWARRINFDQQEAMPVNLGSSDNQEASSTGNAWTINSFFTRLNYGFADKYLFEATLRADGSSRFASDSRWGYFPGANIVWRASEESFVKNLNVFDDLKLRASYGEMGNQSGIGEYDYIELITISDSSYPFGNGLLGQMARQSNLVSADRTWETIISKNIGLDFSMLNNRLYGSLDYFRKNNRNMLVPVSYPSMLGITAPPTNSGKLEVRGWELNLGWRDRIGDFNYSIRGNLSDAMNKVVSRVGNSLITLGLNSAPQGYSTNSYFGYVFDGIIQNEQQLEEYRQRFPNEGIVQSQVGIGDAMYRDLDGDGRLTVLGDGNPGSGDVRYLGDTNPRYNFGISLAADYKGFDFSTLIQGVGKRTMFLEGEAGMPFSQPWYQSASYWYGKTWTPERTDARYPAITSTDKRHYNYYVSTNTRHNVAYVRMKNLQVGYTIPEKHTQKLKIDKIRVYFSGEDLFEFHNAPGGWDPEENGSYVTYPFTRSYAIGASFVF
ncbi:TonB-dependent receptor [Sinomicrobium kalidii]|uniref:TonB-dependent receptor n=1 Tax=Sinomicrobium kalidii TaxID=2900738 RepID=UPI001E290E0C|nr:TonB-dependent receptor [Sinomicrobium kalidii]UGU15443.1 TonB-dependent receptor [Sinomicrobium kalidii]